MNGHFIPSVPASSNSGVVSPSARQAAVSARLVAALIVSCLLHAAVLVLPYLGSSIRETRMMQRQNYSRAFTATLTARIITPISATNLPAEHENNPNSSLPKGSSAEESHAAITEGSDLLPIPAPTYYTLDQLTKRPQPIGKAELDTPEISQIIASGKIILKLWISELGEVVNVEVEKTELPEAFSGAAVAAFRRLHFAAGERHGQRVGSVMRIEVSYDDGRLPPP